MSHAPSGPMTAVFTRKDGGGHRASIIVRGDLRGILRARRVSPATMKTFVRTYLAFIYNGVGAPIAAGVLYHV